MVHIIINFIKIAFFRINLMSRFDFDSNLNEKNEFVFGDIKESFGFEIVYENKVYISGWGAMFIQI